MSTETHQPTDGIPVFRGSNPLDQPGPDESHPIAPESVQQNPEQTIDPRQALIESSLSPYHIHYSEGIEGEAMSANPEAAERNFDTLLVLSDMIRTRTTTFRISGDKHTQRSWAPEPKYDWFFDKYAETGVDRRDFDQPNKIVRLWLEKLGPHNDMAGAEEDLTSARSWLIREDEAANEGRKVTDREFELIAELDMELAEIADDEIDQDMLRREAASYLDHYLEQQEAKGKIHTATIARMKLSSLRIEIARQRLLGTNQLTSNPGEANYARFEDAVEAELDSLGAHFRDKLDLAHERYADEPTDELTDKQKESREREYQRAVGALFETYSYLRMMESIVINDGLAVEKVRPGTMREESGTAHKIDEHSSTRHRKHPDGRIEELPPHGFNFNFDFRYDTLVENPRPGEGIYQTIYFQNKINSDHAPSDKAKAASQQFFAGKQFRYIEPAGLMDGVQRGATRQESLNNLVHSMQTWIQGAEEA